MSARRDLEQRAGAVATRPAEHDGRGACGQGQSR